MSFKNKTVVITGAGSGIGKSLAQRFAKNGANVVMLDIHKDVVQAAADEIVATGYSAIAVPTDVTNREMVFHAADQAVQTFGDRYLGKLRWIFKNSPIFGLHTGYLGPYNRNQPYRNILGLPSGCNKDERPWRINYQLFFAVR